MNALGKVLVAVPDEKIGERIGKALLKAGFEVQVVNCIERALVCMRKGAPHAFVVDRVLFQGVVENMHQWIREKYPQTTLLVLSKKRSTKERILTLEQGADDCLSLFDDCEELIARVKALIRRVHHFENLPRSIRIKDIEIRLDTNEVFKEGRPIELTYTQFRLLCLFATHRDTVFSRDEILEKIWGESVIVETRTVDVHVKRLREKLGEKGKTYQYIQTIHGLGYRFA